MSSSWIAAAVLWQAAGWTMLHFLWIGGLFAVVAAFTGGAVRRNSPQIRYSIAVSQLFGLAFIPCCLFVWKVNRPIEAPDTRIGSELTAVESTVSRKTAASVKEEDSTTALITEPDRAEIPGTGEWLNPSHDAALTTPDRGPAQSTLVETPHFESTTRSAMNLAVSVSDWLMNMLPWVWLLGFPLTCCTLLIGISGAERFRRRCQILSDTHPAVVLCRKLQTVLNLKRRILIGQTDGITSPILVGVIRPLILFPASTLSGISAEQLEMILLHELAHVRRWDNLINLIQRVIEAVLFFHPTVWWLSNRVRLEREHCCDATVVSHIGTPHIYAEMLVQMALSNSPSNWVMGMSISNQLIPRIRKILKQEEDHMQVSRKIIVASLSVLLTLPVVTVVNAQRDPAKSEAKATAVAADAKADDNLKSEDPPDDDQNPLYKVQEPLDPKQQTNVISIKGTVLKEDGQPARWSQVWLTGMIHFPGGRFGAAHVAFVRADKNGQFEFWHPSWRGHDPQPDEHPILWVFARTRDGVLTSNATLNLTGDYRDKKQIQGLELKAIAKADYSGRVTDSNGKPILNARISPRLLVLPPSADKQQGTMSLPPELSAQYSAVTDANGKFTMIGLPESSTILAKIAAPNSSEREVIWGTKSSPELRLEPGGTIRGDIKNTPAKDFCEHVELLIMSARGGGFEQAEPQFMFTARFRPQSDGSFEISDVPPGRYQLMLTAKQQRIIVPNEFSLPVNCDCKAGEITEGIQLKLPDVITGRGRVVDAENGQPIAGAAVSFLQQNPQFRLPLGMTTTDAKGEFQAYLRPGKIVVEADKAPNEYLAPMDDEAGQAIEYTKDFEAPTFKYHRAMTFRGTVVDADGNSVPNADVQSFQPGRKGQIFRKSVTTDESGRFEIPQIDPSDALPLRVRASQGVSTAVVLPANELTESVPIVIDPKNAFRLKGTLVNQRGRPISNASVAVHWHRRYVSTKTQMAGFSSEMEKLKTNEQGQFESSAFWVADQYHVVIEANGYSKTDLAQVKGELGLTYDYGNVQLKGTSLSISGRVMDVTGKPVSNVTVFNSGDAAEVVSTTTDEHGRFQLSGLQDGPVYIFAEHSKYRMTGTYAPDPSKEISLVFSLLSAPPVQRASVNPQALDETRKQHADQLAEWIKEKNRSFRPNLRDNRFNALAKTDPDGALAQIATQSKAMEQRSAILIARQLAPLQPAKKEDADQDGPAKKTALKFVERAASRISDAAPERQIYLKADTGLMFLRLGDIERGKSLVDAAAKDLSESKIPIQHYATNIAKAMAWYDVPRALSYQEQVNENHHKVSIRNSVIVEVARYDVRRALELLNDRATKSARNADDGTLRLELAHLIGRIEPKLAADLITPINNPRTRAEATGWAAVSIADANPDLARSLIDQGFDSLQANRIAGQGAFYYEYVPGVAANLAVQAAQIGHPEIETIIQKVLALRIPAHKGTTSVSRHQATVNAALYLAFIDPTVARRLLADLEPELKGKMLGNGGSESVGMQQWLSAWVIADPEHAAVLLKAEMEKPPEDGKPPYWIDSAYTLLSLPKSEQLEYVRMFGNAGLAGPYLD